MRDFYTHFGWFLLKKGFCRFASGTAERNYKNEKPCRFITVCIVLKLIELTDWIRFAQVERIDRQRIDKPSVDKKAMLNVRL